MIQFNRYCNYCGTPYYICYSCVRKTSWKRKYCSQECFKHAMAKRDESIPDDKITHIEDTTILTGKLKNSDEVVNIVGADLTLGRFDTNDEQTYAVEDFDSYTVGDTESDEVVNLSQEDMKDIIETKSELKKPKKRKRAKQK